MGVPLVAVCSTAHTGTSVAVGVLVVYLQNQLHHLSVNQTVNRFPVDVGDQVSLPQTCFVGWTSLFHMLRGSHMLEGKNICSASTPPLPARTHPDHVMHGVDVRVAHVDPDGLQGEAVLLACSVNDDGGFGVGDGGRKVSARRGVA